MTDSEIYQAYSLDLDAGQVVEAFMKKYGTIPQIVEEVVGATFLRGRRSGYWRAGPLPVDDKGRVVYGAKESPPAEE